MKSLNQLGAFWRQTSQQVIQTTPQIIAFEHSFKQPNVHANLNADQCYTVWVKLVQKRLNSTPTNTSTWPFITFPHSSTGEGQGSVFGPFKFQRMFGKGLECAISGDTSSPCGGKPQCWFTVKALVECMGYETSHSWCGSIEKCVHSWHPPACSIPDHYSSKCNEAENPRWRLSSHQKSGWFDINFCHQQNTTVGIQK